MPRTQLEGRFVPSLANFPVLEIASPSVVHYDCVSIPSYFECIDRGLAMQTRFAILHDARALPHVDDLRRQEFQALLAPRRAEVIKHVVAYASVVASPLERGILTAFKWFIKLPFPIHLFTSEAEARSWLLSRVKAAREADLASTAAPIAQG